MQNEEIIGFSTLQLSPTLLSVIYDGMNIALKFGLQLDINPLPPCCQLPRRFARYPKRHFSQDWQVYPSNEQQDYLE